MIIGVGIDLVEIDRVAGSLARFGDRLPGRIMSAAERAVFAALHADAATALAIAIALKEAGSKAIGTGWSRGVFWRDVVVQPGTRPRVRFENQAAVVARQLGSNGNADAWITVRDNLVIGEVHLLS
jgi:holo-[acyl-carrier protein] synthase